MYRNWFNAMYLKKNLPEIRIEYDCYLGKTNSLTQYNIGQELYLWVIDNLTQTTYPLPVRVVGIRMGTSVTYDVVVSNSELGILNRANNISGEQLSLSIEIVESPKEVPVLPPLSLVTPLEEDLSPEPELTFRKPPETWFGKQLYIGTPRFNGIDIKRLCVCGTLQTVDCIAQIGDLVDVTDGKDTTLTRGVVSSILVEDEFYYTVAVPIAGANYQYVTMADLDASVIRKVV